MLSLTHVTEEYLRTHPKVKRINVNQDGNYIYGYISKDDSRLYIHTINLEDFKDDLNLRLDEFANKHGWI